MRWVGIAFVINTESCAQETFDDDLNVYRGQCWDKYNFIVLE